MKSLSVALGVASLSVPAIALAVNPHIATTRIDKDRVEIQGEVDPNHVLVLRIDDGSSKPHESISWAIKGGKFQYTVQLSDKIRMEGGKTGVGVEASCTVGGAGSTVYLPGKFTLRPKVTAGKQSVTFGDLHGDDGRTSPVSLQLRAKK